MHRELAAVYLRHGKAQEAHDHSVLAERFTIAERFPVPEVVPERPERAEPTS